MTPLVLLVDDDPDYLDIANRAIRREQVHANVHMASSGFEALKFLGLNGNESHPDPPSNLVAVFLDLQMPFVSGWDILRRIRSDERTRDLPVIVVSTSARLEDVRKSYDLGANSYVVKKFDPTGPGRYVALAINYWVELNRFARARTA